MTSSCYERKQPPEEDRARVERLKEQFRQSGTTSGRLSSKIHREEVDMVKAQEAPPVETQHTAAKKIGDFFRSSGEVRGGLPVGCPLCNAAMVVRLRGADGRAFLGCTRYPQCSGSWDVPDSAQEESKNWERQMATPDHVKAMLPSRHPNYDEEMSRMADVVADATYRGMQEPLREGVPPGRITEIRGGRAYVGEQMIGKVDSFGDLMDDDKRTVDKLPKKRGKVVMKEAVDQAEAPSDAPATGVMARLKKSAAKAPYRMARMRALTNGKKAILAAVKPRVQPAAYDIVEAFLNSDAGEGAVIGIIGLAGPMTPKLGKNQHVQRLCEEFLDEGVAKGFNQVLSLVASIVEPALLAAVSEMPGVEQIADKVVPKRRKKRVAADVRVSAKPADPPVEEEEDESRTRPLRAVPG
jgi:hypothetical protein